MISAESIDKILAAFRARPEIQFVRSLMGKLATGDTSLTRVVQQSRPRNVTRYSHNRRDQAVAYYAANRRTPGERRNEFYARVDNKADENDRKGVWQSYADIVDELGGVPARYSSRAMADANLAQLHDRVFGRPLYSDEDVKRLLEAIFGEKRVAAQGVEHLLDVLAAAPECAEARRDAGMEPQPADDDRFAARGLKKIATYSKRHDLTPAQAATIRDVANLNANRGTYQSYDEIRAGLRM